MGTEHGEISNGRTVPKSIRHKKILDVAAERPDASLEAIAEEIPSATADLVENVLEEHGDPAEIGADEPAVETDDNDQPTTKLEGNDQSRGNAPSASEETDYPDPSDLTERQREALRTIHANPQSTQREIADVLGVSGATVSNRVNAIDGFDWSDRRAITEAMFDDDRSDGDSNETSSIDCDGDSELEETIDGLEERVGVVERRLEENADLPETGTTSAGTGSPFDDPDLMHKVMHACLKADTIAEEEELQLMRALLR